MAEIPVPATPAALPEEDALPPPYPAWKRFAEHKLALASAITLVVLVSAAIAAPLISAHHPDYIDLANKLALPSGTHLLGTDENGRDVFARLLYGARVSLSVGLSAAFVAVAVGTVIGSVAAFAGKHVDSVLMRFTDAMLSIPLFFLVLTALTVFRGSLPAVIISIGLTSWMPVSRIVRGDVLKYKNHEFATAARCLGFKESRILLVHLLPQAIPSILVATSLAVAYAIMIESALSYFGLGVQPPTPTWGNMLIAAQTYIWTQPLLAVYPGLMIFISVLAFNQLADGLRDALDPRSR